MDFVFSLMNVMTAFRRIWLRAFQLFQLFLRPHREEDLDESIVLLRAALDLRPTGHPDRSSSLDNLAVAVGTRFEQRGRPEDLDESIELSRSALDLRPTGHPDRSSSLNNLAVAVMTRFQQRGCPEDLDESIELFSTALDLHHSGHPDRSMSLNNLAVAVMTRFKQRGCPEDLDESISLHRVALDLHLTGHLDHSSLLSNLANAVGTRFEQRGCLEDLDESIELFRAALDLHHSGHPDRSMSLNNLAVAVMTRYKQKGRPEDLDESISFLRAALDVLPTGHPRRPSSLSNLAVAVITRFEERGRTEDLDESIVLHRAALDLRPTGHPDRSSSLNNLANGVLTRFEQRGHPEDLDESIVLHRAALDLRPTGHPDRSSSLNNLSSGVITRFQQRGRPEDLDEAISLHRAALDLRPAGHLGRFSSLNNLADTVLTRFEQRGRLEDLDESIEIFRAAAFDLHLSGHSGRSLSLNNLANSVLTRFKQRGHSEDLDDSIELFRAALDLHFSGHPDRSMPLNNLAVAVRLRFEQRGRPEDLDESIVLHRSALDLYPTGHPHRFMSLSNLAVAVTTRFQQKGRPEDLYESISLHRAALDLLPTGHPVRSSLLRSLALSMKLRFLHTGEPEDLEECMCLFEYATIDEFSGVLDRLEIAVQWASNARSYVHATTLRAYQEALSLLQLSLSISPTLQIQHNLLIGKTGHPTLALDAASCAIERGDVEQAIEMLEQGRGLVWAQMRSFRTQAERLSGVGEGLVDKFLSTTRELEALASFNESKSFSTTTETRLPGQNTVDQLYSRKRALVEDLRRSVEAIRATPGFVDFLRAPRFSTLQSSALEGPVIVVNHSRFRSDALIVLRDRSPICVELDSNLHIDGPQHLRELKGVLQKVKEQPEEVDKVLIKVLKFLWDKVVARVVAKLEELGIEKHSRIWWCPTSFLSGLPFHAAGPVSCDDGKDKYLPDLYISWYTPTLAALIEARSRTAARAAVKPSVLIVAQTDSLPEVNEEINAIESTGKSAALITTLKDAQATPMTVMSNLRSDAQQPEWIHFACHGNLNPEEPFNHYFKHSNDEDGDGRLTLLDIMGADLRNVEFAFLSACHSAEQHVDSASEEVIHLAAAVQFSGFRGVVGTMWALADEDGPWIAKRFYKSMFDKKSLEEVGFKGAAKTLNSVTRGLRDLGRRRKDIRLERWVNFVHV